MNWQQLFSPQADKIRDSETVNFAKKSSSKKKYTLKQLRHSPLVRSNNLDKENMLPQFTPNEPGKVDDSFSKLIFKEISNQEQHMEEPSNTILKDLTDNLKQLCKISKKQLKFQQNFLEKLQQSTVLKKNSNSKSLKNGSVVKQTKSKSTVSGTSRKITIQEKIEAKIKQFEKLKKELKLLMSQTKKNMKKQNQKQKQKQKSRAISAFR